MTILVQCDNKLKKPGPVFNIITKHAYDVGADYIYRVNDDTEMAAPWVLPQHADTTVCSPRSPPHTSLQAAGTAREGA